MTTLTAAVASLLPFSSLVRNMTPISNVKAIPDGFQFTAGGRSYSYLISRGRIYIGGLGGPVHRCAEGSFAPTGDTSLEEVAFHARTFGANLIPTEKL